MIKLKIVTIIGARPQFVKASVISHALRNAGHTEILAEFTGSKNFAMMFSGPKLKVILVTIHVGLIDAVRSINPGRVYKTISLANQTLTQMGYSEPCIAVCGINPHAGEGAGDP